jgi:hypothetical protein
MENQWPTPEKKDVRRRSRKTIEHAARIITENRLLFELEQRTELDGDTPYAELYDGTTWRITNGNKREVGLMTTARAGALMTNAGRAADGDQLDPTCACCHSDPDIARHILLQCQALEAPRNEMWELAMDIWDEDQQNEFADKSDQQQYLTLLGKQMEHTLDLDQQTALDTAVKITLVKMDDIRQKKHNLQPMNGRTHNRPPEQSTQMIEQWREMKEQAATLKSQEMLSDSEDSQSEPDSDNEDTPSHNQLNPPLNPIQRAQRRLREEGTPRTSIGRGP